MDSTVLALLLIGTPAADGAHVGDCAEQLVVRPGEGCVYLGTEKTFSVDADGLGRFLFGAFGGSIVIDTHHDGLHYRLGASDLGIDACRIDWVSPSGARSGGHRRPAA